MPDIDTIRAPSRNMSRAHALDKRIATSSPETLRQHDSPELPPLASKRQKTKTSGDGAKHVATQSVPQFKAGALVRMRMTNFMTYDDISYDFGPALNMIIGPNGSGKSTVVAGICLGLGFEPKIMGRASQLTDTIKHGTQAATIELELKAHIDDPNIVIRRQFSHSENGNKGQNDWFIDGKRSNQKKVMEIVRGFNCQIDNLCQFLPQDKVASFARMKPVEMLAETLRTIGDGSLGATQAELISIQRRLVSEKTTKSTELEKLKGLKDRQEVLLRDVERFRERESLRKEISIREMRLPFARYKKERETATIAREQYKAAKEALIELRSGNQPLEQQESTLAQATATAEQSAKIAKTRFEKAMRTTESHALPLKNVEESMTSLASKLKIERDAERANKHRIRELKEAVAQADASLGQAPAVDSQVNELTADIKALNASSRDIRDEAAGLTNYLKTQRTERQGAEKEIEMLETRLNSLSDFRHQRLQHLQRVNVDAYEAVRWLKDNRDQFEHRVFDPVLLEIQVTDKRFAKVAQHVIMQNAFTFTCLSRSDYEKFNRLLVDGNSAGRRLRLNVSEYSRTNAPHFRDHRSPLSAEEIKQYGFDGYLIDFLDGPDAVLNTLCHAAQVHTLPIGSRELSQGAMQNIEEAKKNQRPLFQRYILDGTDTRIFRGYGQTSSSSESLHNDGSIFSRNSDAQQQRQIEDEIREMRDNINGNVKQLNEKQDNLKDLEARIAIADDEKEQLSKKRNQLLQRKKDWSSLAAKAARKREELDTLLNAPAPYQDNMAAIKADQIQETRTYTDRVLQYTDSIRTLEDLYEKYIVAVSGLYQAESDMEAFNAHNSNIRAIVANAEKLMEDKRIAKDAAVSKAKAVYQEATEAVASLSEEEKDYLNDYPGEMTLEEIEHQIEDYRNRINYLAETNGDVLTIYESREKEIADIETSLANKDVLLQQLAEAMDGRRDSFESRLEEMRAKIDTSFGEAFRSIQCLGEIRIGKPEEYEKWSLEIWVQFRDEDQLQMLTGERQSGGERAVSTIFYLMALQSLSIAPFRVVDEINQGMDQRNERQVHTRMVEVACAQDTSQYFLITPKLLTDLEYHRHMKVHCVTSGNLGRSGNTIGYPKYFAALRARKLQSQLSQSVH